jgi:hypothetical protein
MFEVYIDGELQTDLDYSFKTHQSHGEKGYLAIIDVAELGRGRHYVELRKFEAKPTAVFRSLEMEYLEMKIKAKINFWIE